MSPALTSRAYAADRNGRTERSEAALGRYAPGERAFAVSKMPAPFKGQTGDDIDVGLAGTVHVFDPVGPRIATGTARFAQ